MWDNAQKIARSQALFERALFVTPFFAQSTREEVRKFNESYRAKYNAAPNFLAAQGFDAGTLIMNALRTSTRSASNLESAFIQLPSYNGVTGAISVSSTGEVSRRFYVVEVLRDSFQEKMPPSNPSRPTYGAPALSGRLTPSNSPMLGATEKVDSGY
jgi:branched-chain amino acid transport system substrate-binding protein